MTDLRAHNAADNVIVLMFSEFGRRVRDNGSGTDHGAAGATFVLGDKVKGGHYGEYPSLDASKLVQGDLNPNMDFRSIYSTILDKWLQRESGADRERHLRAAGLPALGRQCPGRPRFPGRDPRERGRVFGCGGDRMGGHYGAYHSLSKAGPMTGAMPSGVARRPAPASTTRRRCAWATTATSTSPIAATRTISACG